MNNFLNRFVRVKHRMVVDRRDLTRVLGLLHSYHRYLPLIDFGRYKRDGHHDKWFVQVKTSRYKWLKIARELRIKRVWDDSDIPTRKIYGSIYCSD